MTIPATSSWHVSSKLLPAGTGTMASLQSQVPPTALSFQAQGDADRMAGFGLRFHAVRLPVAAAIPPGASAPRPPPYRVFPLRDVLRGMRAYPAQWPVYHADVDGLYRTEEEQRAAAASCATVIFCPRRGGRTGP